MEKQPKPRLFCFGLGYSAQALGRQLLAEGWRVAGTARSPERLDALTAQGFEAFAFDRDRPLADPERALAGSSHFLTSVPPDLAGDPVLDHHAADILDARPRWVAYLSTTGVYGNADGGWVDESSPRVPSTANSQRRKLAEDAWLGLHEAQGLPVHIFRLSGIYGPGRSQLDTVRAGRAKRLVKPGQVFNRIHVDDIASVLRASIAKPNPGAAYNLADDLPAPAPDVVTFACELLGVRPPPEQPFDPEALSPMARTFYADNKRVANARIKTELGVRLIYPDYRAGLAAQLKAERQGSR
jgi:nucleoside-diphosphate-sugar epimerase